MSHSILLRPMAAILCGFVFATGAGAENPLSTKKGQGGSDVQGAAGTQRDVGSLAQEAAAGGSTKAGAVFNQGDVLYPKIASVKIMAGASEAGKAVATLDKGEEPIYMGVEENGFLKVESGKGGGSVKKILVTK